jgi:hypothetical protein
MPALQGLSYCYERATCDGALVHQQLIHQNQLNTHLLAFLNHERMQE